MTLDVYCPGTTTDHSVVEKPTGLPVAALDRSGAGKYPAAEIEALLEHLECDPWKADQDRDWLVAHWRNAIRDHVASVRTAMAHQTTADWCAAAQIVTRGEPIAESEYALAALTRGFERIDGVASDSLAVCAYRAEKLLASIELDVGEPSRAEPSRSWLTSVVSLLEGTEPNVGEPSRVQREVAAVASNV